MNIGVSIIICTYNGNLRLVEVLNAINALKHHNFNLELIIVDNNSNDNTPEILQDYFANHSFRFPFRIIRENRQGLIFAKICGLQHATFEYIVFCDDDNILDENYVQQCFEIFQNYLEVGIIGGKGICQSPIHLPHWFDEFQNAYAVGEQAENAGFLESSKFFLWGAGMCVRKQAIDVELLEKFSRLVKGRTEKKLLSGEDALFCISALQKKYKLYYCRQMQFYHIIEARRLTLEYLKKLLFGLGYSYTITYKIYQRFVLQQKNFILSTLKDIVYINYFFLKHLLETHPIKRVKIHYYIGALKGIFKSIKL